MDYQQISSALANTTWNFTLEPRPTAFVLNSSTLSDNVEAEMRLLDGLYDRSRGFRPLIDEKLPTVVDLAYRMFSTDPSFVAGPGPGAGGLPGRESMPPRERLAAYRAADFERILKPALTRSPIEVTVVGDISEEDARRAVATTFGALPRRPALPPLRKAPARSAIFPSGCRRR
jgi:zinc protease